MFSDGRIGQSQVEPLHIDRELIETGSLRVLMVECGDITELGHNWQLKQVPECSPDATNCFHEFVST